MTGVLVPGSVPGDGSGSGRGSSAARSWWLYTGIGWQPTSINEVGLRRRSNISRETGLSNIVRLRMAVTSEEQGLTGWVYSLSSELRKSFALVRPPTRRDVRGTVHLNNQQKTCFRCANFPLCEFFSSACRTVLFRAQALDPDASSLDRRVRPSTIRISPKTIHAINVRNPLAMTQGTSPTGTTTGGIGRAEKAGPHAPHQAESIGDLESLRRLKVHA